MGDDRLGILKGALDALILKALSWKRRRRESALLQDLIFAGRHLRRNWPFTCTAILVLGLGIGAAVAVFSVVQPVLLNPLPLPDAHSLVALWDDRVNEESSTNASVPEFEDWRTIESLQATTATFDLGLTLMTEGGPERVAAEAVLGDFFGVMRMPPALGRGFETGEVDRADRVVMLSQGLWRQRFAADPAVIGRTLDLSGEPYTVIGIMPRQGSLIGGNSGTDVWIPLPLGMRTWGRGTHNLFAVGRLKEGEGAFERGRAETEAITRNNRQEYDMAHGVSISPFKELFIEDAETLLWVLSGAVGFLLLIVCANLATLLLARGTSRRREFAIRAAIGAGRKRLVRQLLAESILLAVAGGAAGLILARTVVDVVASASYGATLVLETTSVGGSAFIAAFAVSLFTGVAFGLAPALQASATAPGAVLRDGGRGTSGGTRNRRGKQVLVGSGIALTVLLLAGVGLLTKSFTTLLGQELGFRPESTLSLRIGLPGSWYPEGTAQGAFFNDLLTRVRALPGVQSAALASSLPFTWGTSGDWGIVGREWPRGHDPQVEKRVVSAEFFRTLGIPLLRGRIFDERDRNTGAAPVIISQSLVRKHWPDQDPIGARIYSGWPSRDILEIVGVVGDVKYNDLDEELLDAIYVPAERYPMSTNYLVLRATGDPLDLIPPIRKMVRDLDPRLPIYDAMTMEARLGEDVRGRGTLLWLGGGLSIIALVLSVVGVYAVTSHAVGARAFEIGVRKAVGADQGSVVRMVLAQELFPIALGVGAGLIGALFVTDSLSGLLFQTSSRDPLVFVAVPVFIAATATLATLAPAVRASRIDPAVVLRNQ